MYSARVLKSLIKTKHVAVIVAGADPFLVCPDPKREKIAFYDFRAPNINRLRYHVATHDWGLCLQAVDIQDVYDVYGTIGPRDPPFITPLVKTLLSKGRRLRKSGQLMKSMC